VVRKYKEAQIAEAGTISNVRIIDRAGTSKIPIKPRKKLNLALGTIVGIVLSIGCALIVDFVGAPIKTSKDVMLVSNLPVLGSIPNVRGAFSKQYLIQHHKSSHISEAYRTLRTNIEFVSPDFPTKTLLLTSSKPREGKSTVASNLAIVMALLGKKILLIDTDLRKPRLENFFEIKSEKGVTSILIREIPISSAIVSTQIENLSLIPVGRIPPNPSELLGSQQMDNLIKKVKEEFDYIIFDAPPILNVTDTIVLAAKMDGVLIVVEANKTNKFVFSQAKEALEKVNTRILGVILNKIPSTYIPYYGYHRYYFSSSSAFS
jgi:capsular exopolysaccharide synthesis family protein